MEHTETAGILVRGWRMHVALVGPCAPAHLRGLMDHASAERAGMTHGYPHISVSELAKALHAGGHQLTVVTITYDPRDVETAFTGPNFDMIMVSGRSRPRDFLHDLYRYERRAVAGYLRAAQPDVVHSHWTYEFELAAQDSGLPHVTTAHDAPVTILRHIRDPYRFARVLVAAVARRRIQYLSAVSPYLAERWREQMLFRDRIRVIPNCIPQDVLSMRREPASHPVFLSVGDAGRLKNASVLLRAFRLVKKRIPEAELRMVGHGLGPAGPMESWAGAQGLSGGVSFLGYVDRAELAREYAQAWLYVHASLEESFGLTLLEALACGLPVLGGARAGGVPYVLDHGRAGWLTDVTDPSVLARAMVSLVEGGPTSPPPGTQAYIQDHFAPQVVASEYDEWYRCVLAVGAV